MPDEAQTQTCRSCNITDENINVQPRSDHDISLDRSSHARPENQASEISEINSGTSSLPISLTTSFTSDHSDVSCDIDRFFELRTKYYKNPMLAFLNINSLRNKIIDLREIAERCLPDLFLIEETKLNPSIKTETLLMKDYQNPLRRDRNEFGGGLMLYARTGIVCNRVNSLETLNLELMCSEITIQKKKWIYTAFIGYLT